MDTRNLKLKLLNAVCSCLIHEPKYYSTSSEDKSVVTSLVSECAKFDPEFILKIALYVRDDLNIRSTANFLIALASNERSCQPFIKKYFKKMIRLPSDMLEVVTLYINLPVHYLAKNSIPSALRKSILAKFPDFDVYQLAKYNKEKSQKKKLKKQKEKPQMNPQYGKKPERTVIPVESKPPLLTLKQLIRKVHIAEPAEQVMSIVGKKYPISEETFKKTGLNGTWNPSLSGKRMKLPTPETWETLLSAKGNKHSTWQELIDHKKLPFMAMLRNLRNMIITGISPSHHEVILGRLTDEKSVSSSRQLPWRFLSAYEAINVDLEKMMNDILDNDGSGFKMIEVKVKGPKGKKMAKSRTIKKRVIIPVHMPDLPLIKRYQQAIDTAIRLSTVHNLRPIEGSTVVFCDVSGSMKHPCSSRGNMGSLQTTMDIAILLGLMLQDSCEECDFRIFSSPSKTKQCHLSVPLEPNTILNNIKRVVSETSKLGGGTDFPYDYLHNLISEKKRIDNFIILSDMMIAPGKNEMTLQGNSVTQILLKYRTEVNPDLLFVAIDLYGGGKSIVDVTSDESKNVMVTGFSDNILRFVAERGNKKQLDYVENIDKIKKLDKSKKRSEGIKDPSEGKAEEVEMEQ